MANKFELEESYPIGISSRFSNKWVEFADGRDIVNVEWRQPLKEYDLSKASLDSLHLEYLLQFFEINSGSTFLYRDPIDCFAQDYYYEPEPGIFILGELFPVSATEYQLCKVYIADNVHCVRVITRPENTPEFKINVSISYSINWNTGRVFFDQPPEEQAIKWRGYFSTPVRFVRDEQTFQYESNEPLFSVPELKLIEVRESILNFTPQLPQTVNQALDIDLIVGSQATITKKKAPIYTDAGWYKSLPLWKKGKNSYRTAKKKIADIQQIEACDALWRVTCGGAIAFRYQEQTVRCKSERLTITSVSQDDFEIEPLNLVEIEKSLLDGLDNQTYLITLIDSSGSMNNEIPHVVSTIEQLRPVVRDNIYGGSEELTTKYFKDIQYLGDEKWVDWLARDYRDDIAEPDKVAFLIWINESSPVYHTNFSKTPNSAYLVDLNSFLTSYPQREIFSAVVYAVNFADQAFSVFQSHLIAAHEGTSGYSTALADYGVKIYPDVAANSGPGFYLADLTANSNRAVEFVCRAWAIEKNSQQVESITTGTNTETPIVPVIPQQPDQNIDDFAYIFGTYESTMKNGLFNRDCGDLGYWRSRVPVKGRFITVDDYIITVRLGDGTGNKTGIIPISDTEYADKTFADLGERDRMKYSLNCVYDDETIEPFAKDIETTHIIAQSVANIPPIVYSPAIFRLGQCEANYGFTCKWQENGVEQISQISGAVLGSITSVDVFIYDYQYLGLLVTNNLGQQENIVILDITANPLDYQRAVAGIYEITAVRLDGSLDECGSLFGLDHQHSEITTLGAARLGFTNHDTGFSFEGVDFLPQFGGNVQAREYSEEIDRSNNTNTTFILDEGAISSADLKDGVLEGAKFSEWLVNWNNPSERKRLATGYLGRTTTYHNQNGGLDFQVEMRSLISRLQQKKFFITVKLCPKTFGKQTNGGCRKNLFGLVDDVEVTNIIDPVTLEISSYRTEANFYGRITFTSGLRIGITKLVDSFDPTSKIINLRSSIHKIEIGDTLKAIAKCDKSLEACLKYNNEANHGGFPHVPGIDAIKRTDRG